MYLFRGDHHTYEDSAGQHITRGWFLILVQPKDGPISRDLENDYMRAIVRKVAMQQRGQFMMGYAHAFGHKLILSGPYGSDGLPLSVPQEVFDQAVKVPVELVHAWSRGGGWNSAGSEASAMRHWAIVNLNQLIPEAARNRPS